MDKLNREYKRNVGISKKVIEAFYRHSWNGNVRELDNVIKGAYAVCDDKAKLACSNLAMKVTTECIQNMGGAGYMRENHVERMFRDAKITQVYEGTNEIQRLIISGAIFGRRKRFWMGFWPLYPARHFKERERRKPLS